MERFSEGLPLNRGFGVTTVNRIRRGQSLKAGQILHPIAFQVSLKVSSLLTEKLEIVDNAVWVRTFCKKGDVGLCQPSGEEERSGESILLFGFNQFITSSH